MPIAPAHDRLATLLAPVAATALCFAACASPGADDDDDGDRQQVLVAFEPLQFLVERIGGDAVDVTTLTPPGADPHATELSPARVAELAGADLVVYISGFQPATDEAIEQTHPEHVVDVLEAAAAELPDAPPPPTSDPHFWLDPVRFALAAEQITEALIGIDPDRTETYRDRSTDLVAQLQGLDTEMALTLQPCAGAVLVTAHEAFGYLTARYGLQQESITGIDPEVEPSPARLVEIGELIDSSGARTIFVEAGADPGMVEQVATDLGIDTDVLDPMERPSDPDYFVVMRDNLAALEAGLVC